MYWDANAVTVGLSEIAACRSSALSDLKSLLDQYHRWERPLHYYDTLASDWLEHFAHLVYAALTEVNAGDAVHKASPIPVSPDLAAHALMRSQKSGLHEHLRWAVSALLNGETPSSWTFAADSMLVSGGACDGMAASALKAISTPTPDVLLVNPYIKSSPQETAKTMWNWRRWVRWDNLHYPVTVNAKLDSAWRMSRASSVGPVGDLYGLLRVLLPLHLPVVLLEGFRQYRSKVLALRLHRPKVLYSANALHNHFVFKLMAAEWKEEGTCLLYHQHGGGYGIDKIHAFEEYEARVSDNYFTFGWTNENSKVKAVSPARLHAPKSSRRYVLLSCVDYPHVVYRLHFHPMPGTIETMHRETCAFLASLKNNERLLVRPYATDYGWGFPQMMRETVPAVTFDDRSKSAMVRYAESRLVIHNYLGTGWLETLALDIPTVCFYDCNIYAFRDTARPWIEALERVGIVHRSGSEAARFVDGIACDPDGWWRSPAVREVRQNFVLRYANFSPDWARQWEAEFCRHLH